MGVEMGGIGRAVVLLVFGLVACGRQDVVATVGSTRLTRDDLRHFTERVADRDERDTLEALIGRQLLAEEALRRDLDEKPAVRAALAAARREVLAQALLEEALVVEDGSLRARYEAQLETSKRQRVHVRQIFVQTDARGEREARVRAQALYARVLAGEDFATVAQAESDDRASADRGGELGPITTGQTNSAFFEQAVELNAGQTAAPIRTEFGFHVIQAIRPAEEIVPTYGEVRGRLAAEERQEAEATLRNAVRSAIAVEIRQAPSEGRR